MARGKAAAHAANRRTTEANLVVDRLRDQLATERAESQDRVRELEAEIRHLKSEHLAEASRLAAEEVTRRLDEVERARRAKGMSDDIAINLLYQKDKFVMNACRYISMTKGMGPYEALEMVFAWMTDQDFRGIKDRFSFLFQNGLPSDGWVARRMSTRSKYWDRLTYGQGGAISLDRAEREGHREIHPRYDPRWYGEVKHRAEIVLTDEPERDDAGAAKLLA